MTHEIIRGIIAILSCDACDFGASCQLFIVILHDLFYINIIFLNIINQKIILLFQVKILKSINFNL